MTEHKHAVLRGLSFFSQAGVFIFLKAPLKGFTKLLQSFGYLAIFLVTIVVLYGFIGIPVTYWLTTNEIVRDNNGTYRMVADEETGHIISYLGGCNKLPSEWELRLMRQMVRAEYTRVGSSPPEGLANFNREEIFSLISSWERHDGQRIPNFLFREAFADISQAATEAPITTPGDEACGEIWELVEAAGAFKIRFIEEQGDFASMVIAAFAPRGAEQAAYVPLTNTVYIRYDDSLNVLLDELGHAKQFRERPYQSHLKWLSGTLRSVRCAPSGALRGMQSGYRSEYRTPGSLEHEAHEVENKTLLQDTHLRAANNENNGASLPYSPPSSGASPKLPDCE